MPLWASWLRDFEILNLFYDEFKSEKMAKFGTLIVPRGLIYTYRTYFGSLGLGRIQKVLEMLLTTCDQHRAARVWLVLTVPVGPVS